MEELMFLRVWRRVSYANVVLTVGLVFVMTGGAYAAKHYLITSTKQISPKVLKQLKGNSGAAGSIGPSGPVGSMGPAGKDGVNGANGKDGLAGVEGKSGVSVTSTKLAPGSLGCGEGGSEFVAAEGKKTTACNGSPWVAGGTLPVGRSEVGHWALTVPAVNPTVKSPLPRTAISFVIPLREAPEEGHYLAPGGGKTSECPGTAEEPQAAEGQLCVYAEFELNAPALLNVSKDKVGGQIAGLGGEPGGVASGTWAVTAK